MKKPFKYFLYHKNIGSYELEYDPDMSDQHSLVFARDMVYHGIMRTVGVNVRFIKDGYDFIKAVYETYGFEAEITYTILELNKLINDYQTFFEGVLALSEYKIDEIFVTVGVEETGSVQKFKHREEIKVNLQNLRSIGDFAIPPFSLETVDVSLHSKTIAKKFVGKSNEEEEEYVFNSSHNEIAPAADPDKDHDHTRYATIGFTSQVSEIIGSTGQGTVMSIEEPAHFYEVEEPGQHTFTLNLDYKLWVTGNSGFNPKLKDCAFYQPGGGLFDDIEIDIILKIHNDVDPTNNEIILVKSYSGEGCGLTELTAEEAISYSTSRNLIIGDKVSLYAKLHSFSRFTRVGLTGKIYFWSHYHAAFKPQNSITINALTQSPISTSSAKSLLAFEAFTRVAQAITDRSDPFRSSLYGRTDSELYTYPEDGEGSLRAITGGFAIRQFPLSEKPIFASWKDLFTSFNAIDNIGVGIEDNKIVVEKKSYFYNDSIIFTLDYVTGIEKSVAKDVCYNEVENGFAKWENEEVNGLDEFNSKREWTLPITVIKNKLSILSPYIGSGYAIEFTRRKTYLQTSTEDWKYDNDNFIVVVRRNGSAFEADRDQDFDSSDFENILDPATAYNLKISPKRSLTNWGYYFRPALEKYLDKKVKFAFGDANYLMESRKEVEAAAVIENENLLASSLEESLWLPEYYEFEAKVTTTELTAIKANPYGMIKFSTSNNDYYYGYIINVKVDVENKKGSFKLLRANV